MRPRTESACSSRNEGSEKSPRTTVSVIDLASGKVIATVKTGRGAQGIAIGSDGRYAFVTNIYEATVSVIEIGSMKVVEQWRPGKRRTASAFRPEPSGSVARAIPPMHHVIA